MNDRTFAELKERFPWRPITGCPGRFVLATADKDLSSGELAGESARSKPYRVAAARDEVWVTPLEGGGLISYRRPDGSYLHTLNTTEGFTRKLRQLGIEKPE